MAPGGEPKRLSQTSKAKPPPAPAKVHEADMERDDGPYDSNGSDSEDSEDSESEGEESPRAPKRASKASTGSNARSGNPGAGRAQGAMAGKKNHTAQKVKKPAPVRKGKASSQKRNDPNHDIVITNWYKMRGILDEKEDDEGNLQYEVDWVPTWESADIAKVTPEALKAWQKVKAAREEQRRIERRENNHMLVNSRAQREARQKGAYVNLRQIGLATLSDMDASDTFTSAEAVKWLATFKAEILSELELFLFTEEGHQSCRESDKAGDIIFPQDEKRSHDKYALWASYKRIDTPSGCLVTHSTAKSTSGGHNENDQDQDRDTAMEDEDGNNGEDGEEDEEPDTEEIILTLVPNPYHLKDPAASSMSCGVLFIRGVRNMHQSADFFTTKKQRPPVRQLFDMMLEAFKTAPIRIAPTVNWTEQSSFSLDPVDEKGEYRSVATEVRFTRNNSFERLVEAPQSTPAVPLPEPALLPATSTPRDEARPTKATKKATTVPEPVRAFGNSGAASAAASSGGSRQPLPTTKDKARAATQGRVNTPSNQSARQQKVQKGGSTSKLSTPTARATTVRPGKMIPAKRKSPAQQEFRSKTKGKRIANTDMYELPCSDEEKDDPEPGMKEEPTSDEEQMPPPADEMDIDQGSGPLRDSAGQQQTQSRSGHTQSKASSQRLVVRNVTPGSEVRSSEKTTTGKAGRKWRGKQA
ncbi:hypothetical protein V8F33_004725 [Rhypophila sp. PSN 637]